MTQEVTVINVIVILLLFKQGLASVPQYPCYVVNCLFSECRGSDCSRCNAGYYMYSPEQIGIIPGPFLPCASCPSSCASCDGYKDCPACNEGRYGYLCHSNCNELCKDNICDKESGSCTNGCIDGFYLTSNDTCRHCSPQCLNCSSVDSCYQCLNVNYWGAACQFTCDHCLSCSKSNGCSSGCDDGYYQSYNAEKGGYECKPCPWTCITCAADNNCQSCKLGHWGAACQNTCSFNCYNKKCDKNSGNCSNGCDDGYFGDQCLSRCLTTCKSCSNDYSCETCMPEYFSGQNNACECNISQCNRREGNYCKACSDNTWYPESRGCCPCSASCKDGTCSTNDSCIDCIDTKYGANCESNCQARCKDSLCNRNGSCISCDNVQFYGPTCDLYCHSGIHGCLNCHGLSSGALICTRCFDSLYADGQTCTECSFHCKTGAFPKCDPSTGACETECDTGWFGERCDINCNVANCQTCSSEDQNVCMECDDDFYNETDTVCTECPSTCANGTSCNKQNGFCTQGCDENWSGVKCDIPCFIDCERCDQFNKSLCSLCKEDSYGNSCEKLCSFGCATRNQRQRCDKVNGKCSFGCLLGFWDSLCDKHCGDGCIGNTCNNTSGMCLGGCRSSYYGPMCGKQCSKNCKDASERICDEKSGECLIGCKVGWFGRKCTEPCSENCKGNICDLQNGSCATGCIDGFTGEICLQELYSSEQTGKDASFVTGLAAGLGVALVVAACIVVALIMRRRWTRANTNWGKPVHVGRTGSQAPDKSGSKRAAPDYQNLALNTIITPEQGANNSNERTTTYQELNQDTRYGSDYSTIEETMVA